MEQGAFAGTVYGESGAAADRDRTAVSGAGFLNRSDRSVGVDIERAGAGDEHIGAAVAKGAARGHGEGTIGDAGVTRVRVVAGEGERVRPVFEE